MEEVKIDGLYRHFSGKEYRVIAIARDCNKPDLIRVVYKALYESPKFGKNQVWTREISDFVGNKDQGEGNLVKRFTFVPE